MKTPAVLDDATQARAREAVDLAVRAAQRTYVVRLTRSLTNGQTRSQHFSSLHAALKAKKRAEAAECEVFLTLCRVLPVGPVLRPEVADIAVVLQDFDDITEVDVPALLSLLTEEDAR